MDTAYRCQNPTLSWDAKIWSLIQRRSWQTQNDWGWTCRSTAFSIVDLWEVPLLPQSHSNPLNKPKHKWKRWIRPVKKKTKYRLLSLYVGIFLSPNNGLQCSETKYGEAVDKLCSGREWVHGYVDDEHQAKRSVISSRRWVQISWGIHSCSSGCHMVIPHLFAEVRNPIVAEIEWEQDTILFHSWVELGWWTARTARE